VPASIVPIFRVVAPEHGKISASTPLYERWEHELSASARRAIAFQRSGAILLDTRHDRSGEVEDTIRRYAELLSAAGPLHTFQISELSLWAAASSGLGAEQLLDLLTTNSATRIPGSLFTRITTFFSRFGQLRIAGAPGALVLSSDDPLLIREAGKLIGMPVVQRRISIPDAARGKVKAILAEAGYPVVDNVRSHVSASFDYRLNENLVLRDYQQQAVCRFINYADDGGVVLLPCGAGKTVVGVSIAATLGARVLVVTPNRTIGEQWASHFGSMTTLLDEQIDLFPETPGDKPVTVVTYQALTASREGVAARLHDVSAIPWGLVIFDEVHTLPADVFRQSATLQASRRLGLTATLLREDGREREV
jgi:DNA excision repair protein ERCC-3